MSKTTKKKPAVKKAVKAKKITRSRLGCVDAFKAITLILERIERDISDLKRSGAQRQYNIQRSREIRQPVRSQNDIVPAAEMFDDLNRITLPPSTRSFIDSLEQGMEEYGTLTKRQYDCLYQNWNSFINGVPF